MPSIRVGASANASIAASDGAISPAAVRSKSPRPCTWPSPLTSQYRTPSSSGNETRAPMRSRYPGSSPPGWVVSAGQCGTRTVPPAIKAAPRNGAAFDRSGSTTTRSGSCNAAWPTRQTRDSSSAVALPLAPFTSATVMRICGRLGVFSPVCRNSSPPGRRDPISSRPEMNCEEPDESMLTLAAAEPSSACSPS